MKKKAQTSILENSSLEGTLESELEEDEINEIKEKIKNDFKEIEKDKWNR